MVKKYFLFGILFLFFVNFVSADVLISEAGVEYDSNLIKAFEDRDYTEELVEQLNFIGLKIIDDEVWAKVRVVLKDDSGIEVVGNKSERADLVNERLEWFDPITKKILKELPDSDFKDIKIRSEGFSAFISEKGFEIISNDKRIKEIIWSQYKPEFTDSEVKNKIYIFLSFFLILILLIVVVFLILKKKGKRRGKN